MDSSTQSSQETCESPFKAIFTITPSNAEAKLEFSRVVDWLHEQECYDDSKQGTNSSPRRHASKYMHVEREPVYDSDVGKLLWQRETGRLSASPPSSPPSNRSPPASPSSTRPYNHVTAAAASIWTGFYYLDLSEPPRYPKRGWGVGRLRSDQRHNDIVFSLTADPLVQARKSHAALQLSDLGRIIVRCAAHSICLVNNTTLSSHSSKGGSRSFHINAPTATLTLGCLKYYVEYTPFARSADFRARVEDYLLCHLDQKLSPLWDLVVETPRGVVGAAHGGHGAATAIQIGQWQITWAGPVGKGTSGHVSIGVNSGGKTVALKRVAVNGDLGRLLARQETFELITRLLRTKGETRVLRLVEAIWDDGTEGKLHAADVWFVLEPTVPSTLADLCTILSLKDRARRMESTRHVILEILRALHFLHANGWIHGDLKPNNIGVLDQYAEELQIVLLDMDEAFPVLADGMLHFSRPGAAGGTIGWLSPEREMTGFDQSCDIWSLGVLAFWLVTGEHPWKLAVNPWRPGWKYNNIRPQFHAMYQDALLQIREWEDAELAEVTLQMLRHPYAKDAEQQQTRITAAGAMAMLEPDERQQPKRMKES